MQRPVISVLINNYNYGRFIGAAIESALCQGEPDVEVIVVDDGSSDQSRCVLETYGARLKVLFQENRGQAAAINAAVAISTGEILCFLDADDWWAPGKLSAIAAAFGRYPDASLVYHRVQPTLVDGKPTLKPIPRTLCSGDLSPRLTKSAGYWPFPMTSALAVRRSAWTSAGDIPDRFRISADAWLTGIYPFLGPVVALPETLGFYRIHDNNWYRPVDDAPMLQKRIAHWQACVEETNRFLSRRNFPARLRLSDHFPSRVACARLAGVDAPTRFRLLARGLCFSGEPNLLRRTRDALRAAHDLPRLVRDVGMPETTK
jgi:glycosyltransferase involved in cell wall biosynthesis